MTLTLTIRNVPSLDNGMPTEFVLHRRGATIGRAATCDWSLPDPHRYISSRHCEISFRDEAYWLSDISTNGTFVNGAQQRLESERKVEQGDVILVGHYEIVAELSGSAMPAPEPVSSTAGSQGFAGWDKFGSAQEPAAQPAGGWDTPAPSGPPPATSPAGSSDWGPSQGNSPSAEGSRFKWGSQPPPQAEASDTLGWAPTHNASDMPDGGSVWQAPEAPPDPASGWSSAAPDRPAERSTDDIWGRIAEGNVVDWARGGFGAPRQEPPADPLGLKASQPGNAGLGEFKAPRPTPEAATAPSPPAAGHARPPAAATKSASSAAPADLSALLGEFLAGAGLSPQDVKGPPGEVIKRGGGLLRRLIAGLVVLVEARARAKSQMGAESTRLEFDGNNPIKFARTPEQALAQLLNPKERGFMDAERAVEDAFFDLQSHQMATLKAMQGALRATLDRFAPEAIRKRAASKGLAKVLPAARDAALWQAYEREFSGVARGSDEAFMDVFAKEFRKAYEEQARSAR